MNSEESRLRTFVNWPENAVVDSKRIARAGFYYMGQGLEVQCFRCGGRISDWNYGDKVMAKHKALDPRCPFVQNPANSGNIPLLIARRSLTSPTEQPETKKKAEDVSFADKQARLDSFSTWPFQNTIVSRMAQSGFYYLQEGTKVRCAYCNGTIEDWRECDDPDLVHLERFPNCAFVKESVDKGALVNSGSLRFQGCDGDGETFRGLGIQSHRIPRTPRYSTYESRIRTFAQWPPSCVQRPAQLAEAGFYFKGPGDEVRCFHCDGGLRLWQKDDIPWIEHARWFNECGFLALVKGPEYIDEVGKLFPPKFSVQEIQVLERLNKEPLSKNVVTENQLRDQMSTHVAMMALQVGIEASRVKSAIRHKIETTGVPFEDADSLIVAALDVQSEENQSMDEEYSSWSVPPGFPISRVRAILPRVDIYNSTASDESEDEEERICMEERKRDELQSVKNIIEEPPKPKEQEFSLEEENRKLKEARLCKICMDVEVGVVFLPCGHLVTCANCAHSLKHCPLCRQLIKATVRTFLC